MQTPEPPEPPPRRWTDEQRLEVKAMLATGATASMVAKRMKIGRNAALGRIWRDPELQLQRGNGRGPHKVAKRVKTAFKTAPRATPFTVVSPAGDPQPVTKPVKAPPARQHPTKLTTHPMALIGTGRRWCKWPIDENLETLGRHLCCGAQSLPGDVYCVEHRALARPKPKEAPTCQNLKPLKPSSRLINLLPSLKNGNAFSG